MGKKYKKKVQWKQLSLNDLITTDTEKEVGYDCEEEGDSAPQTPTHETPYPRHPYKPNFNNPRRGPHHHHHGYYHANYDRRFEKHFDRYHNEQFRNLENRGGPPFDKPYNKPFYDRNYHHDKFYGRPPFYGDRNFRFAGGFVDRGRRPFRPYGRPGFFPPRGFHGPFRDGPGRGINGCEGEEEEGEWDDEGILVTEGQQQQMGEGFGGGERPSQPVHTVVINNEEYTKIQTPRQEVIFKKSSLDRKRDSIDQGSVTGSMTSGSGSSITTGGDHGSGSGGSGDQVAGDGSSVAGSVEDTSLSMTGDDPSEGQHQNQVYEDPNEMFAGEPGGPPLAGVVMQQAYPGGPMIAIPVHWTPFIDPGLIPGETALTPLDPAFTHVIDPKALPIDPLHIIPVQHDASGCPVHVQVKVDSNGVPVQIQPTAFTVSLSSIHHQHEEQQHQQDVLSQQEQQQQQQQQQHHQQQQQHHHHQQEQPHHEQHPQGDQQQCSTELHHLEEHKTEAVDGRLREEQVEGDSDEHRPSGERPVSDGDGEQTDESCGLSRQSSEGKEEVVEDLEGSKEHGDHVDVEKGEEQHVDAEEEKVEEEKEEEKRERVKEENEVDEVIDKHRLSECEEEVEEKVNREQEKETVEEEKRDQEENREVEEEEKREQEDVKEDTKRELEEEEGKIERKEEKIKQEEEESGEGEIVEVKGEVEEKREQEVEEAEGENTNEVVKEEEEEVKKHCIRDEGEEKSNKGTLKVDTTQDTPTTTTTTTTTTTEVPVPSPDVPETTSSPAGDARERGGSEEQQTPQEEEEEEEEEDMLAKESEEGSESSDSQYASMSESSSTPTTPACEPSYSHETTVNHEAPENHREACKDIPEANSAHTAPTSGSATDETAPCDIEVVAGTETSANKMETSETSGTSETNETNKIPGTEETTGDSATTQQPPDATESTENVLQGYVMVPILTPYYDPSVLYGYPVVVADQHQQQHQRGYSKRKKKKYHRRRHADVPAAGGYLDPQLYTGEPFVATPGGYVVPLEAATSVCQVHGFQYVTPAFHPQHPDEGYAQSPYLPTIVLDPAINQEQYIGGTNLEDPSKTIFGDLQEKERRQIQEILHEQRAKVGKSDSTESSDSGVSESEEAVAAELFSDEQDAHKNDQEASTSCANTENDNLTKDSLNTAQHNDESPEPIVSNEEDSKSLQNVSHESIEDEQNSNLNVKVPEIVDEPLNAQCELTGDTCMQDHVDITTVSDDDQQNQLISIHDASIQQDSGLIERCSDSNTANDTVTDTVLSAEALQDQQDRQVSCSTDKSDEEYQYCETSINNLSEDNEPSCVTLVDTPKELSATQNYLGNAAEFAVKVKTQVTTNSADNTITVQSQTQTVTSGTKELPLQQEYAQENSAVSSKQILDQSTCQRINSPSTEECTDDSSIDRECFKDLKVTEAVKRWIREVTPEKAFFLTEVHTRLLEQDIQEDMDTEDEYIEDEIPQTTQSTTIRSSKNAEGNPFVAASSDASTMGMESCSKRVAISNRNRGTTPDTIDDYDGSSTISNLSYDHLYSEASSSQPASFNHSFDEEVDKYTENPTIYNPVVYAKYYQLGVEVDDTTPTATPLPQNWQVSQETTPVLLTGSENISECGSEDIETVPHKYDVVCQYTATSPMSLATEILKAEKVLSNMTHITGSQHTTETSENRFGNPDIYLKHYGTGPRMEVGDSGVQSEESSDEMEARSNVGSSGVGSSLASTPAVSPAHRVPGRPFQQHPLKNLTAGEGPVPCRTVCCAVM